MTLKKANEAIARYDAGERSQDLAQLLFKCVEYTLTEDSAWDITEREDIDEAASYLRRRLMHNRFKD